MNKKMNMKNRGKYSDFLDQMTETN
jgi:hypothetical protein